MRFKITKNILNLNSLAIEENCIGVSDTFIQLIDNILANENIVDCENYVAISSNLQLIKRIIQFLNNKFPDIKLTATLYHTFSHYRLSYSNNAFNTANNILSDITTSMTILPKNFNKVIMYNTDGMLNNIAYKNIFRQPLSLIKTIDYGRLNLFEGIISLSNYLETFLTILTYISQEYQFIETVSNDCTPNDMLNTCNKSIDLIKHNLICANSILKSNARFTAKDIWNARRLLIDAWIFTYNQLELCCTIYFTKNTKCIDLNNYFNSINEMTKELDSNHIPISQDSTNVYRPIYKVKKPVHVDIMRDLEHKYLNKFYNFIL